LLERAAAEDVVLGVPCFVGVRPDLEGRSVVLGFGGVAQPEIAGGVARLARAVERSLARPATASTR
jgi:GntR family transcriptional regulator/MocR family aminotransferase